MTTSHRNELTDDPRPPARSDKRPVVLILAQHYLPGVKTGGPTRSIRNLVASLADDFDFHIYTTNRDFGSREPYAGIKVNQWIARADSRVWYSNRRTVSARRLGQVVAEICPDIIHVNSFMNPGFSILPLVSRSWAGVGRRAAWIIAPRGEFAPGALGIKATKKRIYLGVARMVGLHRGLVWHATGDREAEDIRRVYGVAADDVMIAPNVTEAVGDGPLPVVPRGPGDRLEVCFLGRVTPMKNVSFAVDSLTRLRQPVRFHVYGPVEDRGYAEECNRIASRAGGRLVVEWHGEVPHDRVRAALAAHDLLLIPTRGENFGHAIFEALAVGVPVLVSDQTPWRDLDLKGVGWVRPLGDPQVFTDVIDAFSALSVEERMAMRHRVRSYACAVSAETGNADASRLLFDEALRRARGWITPPPC